MDEQPLLRDPAAGSPSLGSPSLGSASVGSASVGSASVGSRGVDTPEAGSPGVGTWTPDGEIAGKPSEDALIAAIATVYDPEIPVNIYELGLIYAIEIADDGAVKVEMTLTAPGCPSAQELPEQVRDSIMAVPGVSACAVETVWDPPWDPSRMTEEARLQLNMF